MLPRPIQYHASDCCTNITLRFCSFCPFRSYRKVYRCRVPKWISRNLGRRNKSPDPLARGPRQGCDISRVRSVPLVYCTGFSFSQNTTVGQRIPVGCSLLRRTGMLSFGTCLHNVIPSNVIPRFVSMHLCCQHHSIQGIRTCPVLWFGSC
jgi:hypothetical protein